MGLCTDWRLEILDTEHLERIILSEKTFNDILKPILLKLIIEDKENFIRPSNKTT